MQIPRRFNTFCPYCNAHEEHEVERVRTGRSTGMKWSDRQQERNTGIGNDGRFSKAPVGKKPSQKTDLKYRCSECGKAHLREGTRTQQLELQE